MSSIKDVALDAGVSIATVSYVLNGNKFVSPELTDKVNESIKKLNYQANPVARSLRSKRTKNIGVILQNIRNIFFPQLLAGLEECMRAQDFNLIFSNSYNDLKIEKDAINTMRGMWVDGIILDSCAKECDISKYVDFLKQSNQKKKIPIVMLERNLCPGKFHSVAVDNVKSGYIATKHLLDLGRSKILHIAGTEGWSMSTDRKEGYLKALRERDLASYALIYTGEFRAQDGYAIIKERIMQNHTDIDAVFAANDQMALGAMTALKEYGIRIPDDIAIVGIDNVFASSIVEPSLTTVNVPKYTMGCTAAKLLLSEIEQPSKEKQDIVLDTNLIVRQSTNLRGEKTWDLFGW